MSADEDRDKNPAAPARERTGPRHAAPKKPLFTRLHMPAGKAIAMAAMPTAVLMGMGFTPTLALADDKSPSTSNSLTADEYKDCVAALADDASASPTPDADESTDENQAEPTPSASPSSNSSDSSGTSGSSDSSDSSGSSGDSSSSDSGSDDAAEPTPSPSASKSSEAQSSDTTTPSPSASESGGNLLEDIGDAITGIFTGGKQETASPSPTPSASASASAGEEASSGDSGSKDTSDSVKETTDKVTDTAKDAVKDTTDAASKAAEDTTGAAAQAAEEAADEATASPSPSESATPNPENCPVATDDEGGIDNKILVPDDPWYLEASSLLLKGADYQGIVEVKTASGKTKKVLKYVISDGTDIGDLHQIVKDKLSGKTHHVQAAKGSTSTIRDGKTVMYTESISGNLLGLIPVTFDPKHPPPLNIPLIYFTNVKVTQAGQFGGTLTVPGLHQYITD